MGWKGEVLGAGGGAGPGSVLETFLEEVSNQKIREHVSMAGMCLGEYVQIIAKENASVWLLSYIPI